MPRNHNKWKASPGSKAARAMPQKQYYLLFVRFRWFLYKRLHVYASHAEAPPIKEDQPDRSLPRQAKVITLTQQTIRFYTKLR